MVFGHVLERDFQMYKSYGVLVGCLIAIMVTFNGILASHVGDYPANVIIQIVALTATGIIVVVKKLKIRITKDMPLYWFSGGVIGAVMTIFNTVSFAALGVSLTLALGLIGQLVASGVIDHFGLFGLDVSKFNKNKTLGFVIIAIGITVMVIY